MKELFLIKNQFGTSPLDDDSIEIYRNFPFGSIFRADHWQERKVFQHRALFLLAQIVTDNNPVGKWGDPYNFIKTMQLDVKSVIPVKRLSGEVVEEPKSIKFKNMGNVEFRKLFSDCADLLLANLPMLLPGMSPEEFNGKVNYILDLCKLI
jgi:hypothetical protein